MKQTLVIVPGWGGTRESWTECVAALRDVIDDIRVIELPCFGDEPCPSEVWGVAEYADFLTKKIKEIESDRIILMAHSFGGAVSTRAIAEASDLADSYIMIGAAIVRPNKRIKRHVAQFVARAGKLILSLPGLRTYKESAQKALYKAVGAKDYLDTASIKRDIFKKIIREDQQQYLKDLHLPVRVLWGAKDTSTLLRHGKRIFQQLPSATLRIVPDGRHGLHHTHIDIIKEVVQDAMQ